MTDPNQQEKAQLLRLEAKFQQAITANQNNDVDRANKLFEEMIKEEPRFPEARLEYAFNLLNMERFEEALGQVEEATRLLEIDGAWLDIDADVILSMAYSLQGETLRELAGLDENVFRNPEQFTQLMERAKSSFKKAAALDQDNAHAQKWGFEPSWENPMAQLDQELLNRSIPEEEWLEEDSDSD